MVVGFAGLLCLVGFFLLFVVFFRQTMPSNAISCWGTAAATFWSFAHRLFLSLITTNIAFLFVCNSFIQNN